MYRAKYRHQVEIKRGFRLTPNGELPHGNRWEMAVEVIPWDGIEEQYKKSTGREGHHAYSSHLAFRALYIMERMNWSDEETVEQIRDNPYLQMFLGFMDCQFDRPFGFSLMVHFRKRFGKDYIMRSNDEIISADEQKKKDDRHDGDGGCFGGSDKPAAEHEKKKGNRSLRQPAPPLISSTPRMLTF